MIATHFNSCNKNLKVVVWSNRRNSQNIEVFLKILMTCKRGICVPFEYTCYDKLFYTRKQKNTSFALNVSCSTMSKVKVHLT